MTIPATTETEPAREGDTITVQVAGRKALDGRYTVELVGGVLIAARYDSSGARLDVELNRKGLTYRIVERSALSSAQHRTLRELTIRTSQAMLETMISNGDSDKRAAELEAWAALADFRETLGQRSTYEREMSLRAA